MRRVGEGPLVVRQGVLDCQVCVPEEFSDGEVKEFADLAYPCGTTGGWLIRREGDPLLSGDPERAPCDERPGFVHVVLDA